MPKPAIWMFALCVVLLPLGRAVAKPRVERPLPVATKVSAPDESEPATKRAKKPAPEPAATKASDETENTAKRAKKAEAASAKVAKKSKREPKVKQPCFSPEVHVARRRGDLLEHRQLALTFCDGSPNPAALDSVSVLARPRDVERPLMPEIRAYRQKPLDRGPRAKRRRPDHLTEHVMRVNADLLPRLQKIAQRFPGKTIEIVSGHRPDARDTSRHHHGRALDIRVDGVSREALRDFLRGIDETGVGYYPNSYFVHMDVRDKRGYWIDRSGPGEVADYGTWPPTKRDVDRESAQLVASAMRDLAGLKSELQEAERPFEARVRATDADEAPRFVRDERDVPSDAPSDAHEEPGEDALTRDEVARIRAEALGAIEAL